MYDPLQCGIFECRTFVPHNSFSQSAQYYGAAASRCEGLAKLVPGQTYMVMEKPVSDANMQFNQKLEPREVNSLVQTLCDELT